MSILLKFNATLIKIPPNFFVDIEKIILKFICKAKGTKIAKTILKNNKVKRINLYNSRTYSITKVI